MHHIYHTEGFILKSKNYKEADKYYAIFTRDHGMLYASAQGVRKMSSKLRFILQDFSYIKIDLVRGKNFWRITSASKTGELDGLLKPEISPIVGNLSRLLIRLLAGEEANEKLFVDLINGFSILEKSQNKKELHDIEIIMVLQILNNLGYLDRDKDSDGLINSPFERELLLFVSENRREMLSKINRALRETQL